VAVLSESSPYAGRHAKQSDLKYKEGNGNTLRFTHEFLTLVLIALFLRIVTPVKAHCCPGKKVFDSILSYEKQNETAVPQIRDSALKTTLCLDPLPRTAGEG